MKFSENKMQYNKERGRKWGVKLILERKLFHLFLLLVEVDPKFQVL